MHLLGMWQMLFTSDTKGYVKAWDLTPCNVKKDDKEPPSTPLLYSFRAHHEHIVSVDEKPTSSM